MGLFTGAGSIGELFTNPAQWWDYFKNGRSNTVNQDIANQNLFYQMQRNSIEDARYEDETSYNRAFAENDRAYNRAFAEEQRAYNRALQQKIFEREDTAIERQAESLSKLGINPLSQNMNGLGSGQAVSGSSPSSSAAPTGSSRGGQALHNDFQMQDTGNLSAILSFINSIDNINTNGIQRDLLLEQKNFQRLQNESQAIENQYKSEKLSAEIEDIKSSSSSKRGQEKRETEKHPYEVKDIKATSERNERENKFQEDWSLTDNTGGTIRSYADLAGTYNTFKENRNELMKDNPLFKLKKSLSDSAQDIGNSLSNMINSSAKKFKNNLKQFKNKYFYTKDEFENKYRR